MSESTGRPLLPPLAATADPGAFERALEVRADVARKAGRAGWSLRTDVVRRGDAYVLVVESDEPGSPGPLPGEPFTFLIGSQPAELQSRRIVTELRRSGLGPTLGIPGPTFHSGTTWCAPF